MKWVMYSCHDSNLAAIMTGLNFTNYKCLLDEFVHGRHDALNCNHRPYFAASILLELHSEESSGDYNVMIKFDGEY